MKRVLFVIALIAGTTIASQAQSLVNPHAIGLRFGGNGDINGGEISYQHGMGSANRLEVDLGFSGNDNDDNLFIAGIYHWNWNIDGGFNWYAGPGAAIGSHKHKHEEDHINIGLGGQIGIEYDFNKKNVPLLLSLDARPMWSFMGSGHGLGWGSSLALRYTF